MILGFLDAKKRQPIIPVDAFEVLNIQLKRGDDKQADVADSSEVKGRRKIFPERGSCAGKILSDLDGTDSLQSDTGGWRIGGLSNAPLLTPSSF